MPSVRAADGRRSAPRPCRRHGAPGGVERDEVGELRRGQRVDPERLDPGERAHGVDEPPARAHRARRARRAARAAASASSAASRGCTRQRASGRRRSTPSPVHGASSSTRSKVPSRDRQPASVGDDGHDRGEAGTRAAPRIDRAHARRLRRRPRPRDRRRACARRSRSALPPGAAATSSTRSPGCGSSAATTAWLAWSCGVTRPSRTAASAPRSPVWRTRSAPGTSAPRLDLDAGARSSAATSSVVVARRVHAQRDRRRLVVERERGERVVAPELVDEGAARSSRDATSDRRSTRTSSPAGNGHGGPERAQRAQHAVGEAAGARSDTTPTVSPTAACGDTPVQQLERTEPQAGAHVGIERVDRPRRRRGRGGSRAARRMRTVP